MTERQQFENWASMPPREWSLERFSESMSWPDQYCDYKTQCAWESWQARGDADSNQAIYEEIEQ